MQGKEPRDHSLAVIKAAVAAIPTLGGPIASLIGDYIPTATEKARDTAIDMLKQRLDDLGDRVSTEGVNKDEFVELFKSCYLTIVRTHQERKLRAAANLIANILLRDGDPEKLTYTELDHFVRCLDSLSIGAISVLGRVVKRARDKTSRRVGVQNVRLNFGELRRDFPDYSPDLLMGLLGELNSFHLIHLTGTPEVRVKQYENYPVELPPLGVRFVTYVLGETGLEERDGGSP